MRVGIAQVRHARAHRYGEDDPNWCWEVEALVPPYSGESVESYLRSAVGLGVDMLVFPEGFPSYAGRREEAQDRGGEPGTCKWAVALVEDVRRGVEADLGRVPAVVFGGDLLDAEGNRRNALLFANGDRTAEPYFKNRLWDEEWTQTDTAGRLVVPGTRSETVWKLGAWQVIPRICADVWTGHDQHDCAPEYEDQDAVTSRLHQDAVALAARFVGRTVLIVSANAGTPGGRQWKASLSNLSVGADAPVLFANFSGFSTIGHRMHGGGKSRLVGHDGVAQPENWNALRYQGVVPFDLPEAAELGVP